MKPNIILKLALVAPLLSASCTPETSPTDTAASTSPPPAARTTPPRTPLTTAHSSPAVSNPAPTTSPPAAPAIDENEPMQKAALQLGHGFFTAIAAGDNAAAKALTASEAERARVLAEGYRLILGPRFKEQNEATLKQLLQAVKGRKVTDFSFKLGSLTEASPQGSFTASVIHMQNAAVSLHVDGIYLEIRLDQLIFLDDNWKILEMSLP